ncbi:MAG TPA: twin-arginine translocase TatA/TatE family subunit [Anaeromyxobacteraceae bacterium]|nr:twin-arginine translocase TatA/TatE family subunit [Anaeromyxobacteraceae bacterium]
MAEMLVVLFVVLLIFGAGKIPALGDGLGRAIKNFRTSYKGEARPPAKGEPPKPPPQLGSGGP